MQTAVGFDYKADLAKHGSQVDAAKGFGGKYGVQKERKDEVGISSAECTCIHIATYIYNNLVYTPYETECSRL